jgi:hypothetical protein
MRLLPFLAFAVVGCGSVFQTGSTVQTTVINPAPRPLAPRPPETVEVFTTGVPEQPHVDVALLEVEQASGYSGDETPEMIAALRTRGAELGCDAIVFNGITSHATMVEGEPPRKGVYATCVVYRSPGDPAAAMAYHARAARDRCLADRQETLALARRVDDPKARANITRAAPACD